MNGRIIKKSVLIKIGVLFMIMPVSVPLRAEGTGEKGWYPTIQSKGWYSFEGQSSGSSWGDESKGSTSTTQPATTQPTTTQSSANPMQTGINTTTNQQSGTVPATQNPFNPPTRNY